MAQRSPWMDSAGEGELDALRELARTFCAREVLPNAEKYAAQGHPDRALYRRAGELGLLCMSIPPEYGGGGGTFAHEAVLFEEGARCGEAALGGMGVHNGIVAHYVLAYAGEEQRRRWLPKLAAGEWIGAIAMTEPGTGSDLQGITTRAVLDEATGEYVVTGSKTFITNGHTCDLLILAVKTDPEQGAAGVSLLVAEVGDDTPGFRRGRILDKIGQKSQDTAELFLDGLRVPRAHLLGDAEGQGFYQLVAQLPQERLIVAVGAVASMEAAVDLTVAYTKERQAFGKPLFGQQNTRFELADCATLTRVARTFLDDCVARHLRGELDIAGAAMAKYWLTEQQCAVIDRCLQLFGGYGYMSEYPIARMYADARVQKIYAGANEVMKELVARSL
ncbi:MAG TPA: acyl-CoA dehydrogenase family protein [Pseudonocardiaceae bacterium]